MQADDIIYKNRQTGKEVGRIIMPGDNIVKITDARSTQELIANNFDGPKLSQGRDRTSQERASGAYANLLNKQDNTVDYQDMSRSTTSLAVAENVAFGYAGEAAAAKVGSLIKGIFAPKGAPAGALDGSFSIWNWEGYPAGIPKPNGPFRILEGEEYATARATANSANRALSKDLGLPGKFVDIHEVVPVKFGGSPTNINNKIFLDRTFHQSKVTPFWNKIMNGMK